MDIGEITKTYRERHGLTLDGFGQALAAELPGVAISRQLVNNWEAGRQTPAYYMLIAVVMVYSAHPQDWRPRWAMACLHALRPELWPALGEGQSNG